VVIDARAMLAGESPAPPAPYETAAGPRGEDEVRGGTPLTAADTPFYSLTIVDPDPKLRTRLAKQLDEGASSYPSLDALIEDLRPGRPAIVVFGAGFAGPEGLAEVAALTRSRPELGAILVASELSTHLLQQALRSGIRDVIANPTEPQQLLESVERVAATLTVLPGYSTPAEEAPRGRVITVSSTKGGAGKSVVATNLAVLLARRAAGPVCLVDADLQFGDVAVLLKLTPQHTIVDAVSAIHRLDAQLMQSLLSRHDPSGLLILAAPIEPSFADQITSDHVLKVIDVLRQFCEYVVVDTPAQFNDVVLGLIEASDDVLLVAGMDIPNIKNVKLGLQTLRLLSIASSKLRLILNRANSKVKLDVGEVERTLQMKADSLIPSDIVVPQSVNKGVPAVLDAPKSSVARAFEQLADLFSHTAATSKARGR
jgi:pilus assembly protein CpaE